MGRLNNGLSLALSFTSTLSAALCKPKQLAPLALFSAPSNGDMWPLRDDFLAIQPDAPVVS